MAYRVQFTFATTMLHFLPSTMTMTGRQQQITPQSGAGPGGTTMVTFLTLMGSTEISTTERGLLGPLTKGGQFHYLVSE